MGCGASTIPIQTGASTPIDHASNISNNGTNINNNNIKGQDNLNLKRIANGSAIIPNGGQIRMSGVYGGFRNNSVAPSPISVQQQLQLQPHQQQQSTLGDDELSAIEEVIFEQHKSNKKSTVKFQSRPLSSIQESPSSVEEDISSHNREVEMIQKNHGQPKSPWTQQKSQGEDSSSSISSSSRLKRSSSVAIQTDHRSPASLIRLKSKKTQTDHELFPEDELEVLLNKTDGRLIDVNNSSSLYSSDDYSNTGRESVDSSILTHSKGNFIKQLSQTQRFIAPPVASFISSSVLLQNKRGSCDAIVQVKLICTFDQAIQTVLSLIAPSKSLANENDVDSLNHSSLDSSQLISPAITPSPEPVNSPQDIESKGNLVNCFNEHLGDTSDVTTFKSNSNNKTNNLSDVVTVDAKDDKLNEEDINERKDYTSNSDATNDENNTTMTPIATATQLTTAEKIIDNEYESKDTLLIAQPGHSNSLDLPVMNTLESHNESPHYVLSNINSGHEDMDTCKATTQLDQLNEQLQRKVTLKSEDDDDDDDDEHLAKGDGCSEKQSPKRKKGEKRSRSGDQSSLCESEKFYKETSCDSSNGHLRDRLNQSPFTAGGLTNSSTSKSIIL